MAIMNVLDMIAIACRMAHPIERLRSKHKEFQQRMVILYNLISGPCVPLDPLLVQIFFAVPFPAVSYQPHNRMDQLSSACSSVKVQSFVQGSSGAAC